MSTPWARASRMTCRTSSSCSPRPSMMAVLVLTPGSISFDCARTPSERSYRVPAARDRAEAAVPGAAVAQDHERRGAAIPALRYVGAARALADGVQPVLAHQAEHALVARARRHAHLEPIRAPLRKRPRRSGR